MKIPYLPKKFRKNTLELIATANSIIEDYAARGYSLTLRQLYYQLVARNYIPNTEASYNKLGTVITEARDAGLVDWFDIIDRTRFRRGLTTRENAADALQNTLDNFRIDKWYNQPYRLFIWVEKEALAGVISKACTDEDIQVEYISCRGYMSASTIWREAMMLRQIYNDGQMPIVIHLGDHDPSGIDMTRDNLERLQLYSDLTYEIKLIRIALNMDQVEEYKPPPNFAKLSDTRAPAYIEMFGSESWELDALDPDILVSLIQDTINTYKDIDLWAEAIELEAEHRAKLQTYNNIEKSRRG